MAWSLFGGSKKPDKKPEAQAQTPPANQRQQTPPPAQPQAPSASGGYQAQRAPAQPQTGSGGYPAQRAPGQPSASGGYAAQQGSGRYTAQQGSGRFASLGSGAQRAIVPKEPTPAYGVPVLSDDGSGEQKEVGYGTGQMQAMLQQVLATYPPHYQAALRALGERPAYGHGFTCVGAMETALDEDGMEITFDFRRNHPTWQRVLVAVTMCAGTVGKVRCIDLLPGQSSGIAALDQAG